jgi:hypothetical protein
MNYKENMHEGTLKYRLQVMGRKVDGKTEHK